MMVWKIIFLFQGCILRFYVNLSGCIIFTMVRGQFRSNNNQNQSMSLLAKAVEGDMHQTVQETGEVVGTLADVAVGRAHRKWEFLEKGDMDKDGEDATANDMYILSRFKNGVIAFRVFGWVLGTYGVVHYIVYIYIYIK